MKIHHALPRSGERGPIVLAIGFFDGFHSGHQAIVKTTLGLRGPASRSGVLTFANHPASHLRPGSEPPLIMTLEERVNSIAAAGIDETFIVPFDSAIASLSPRAFVEDVLLGAIGARAIVVGENFRFGAERAGDVRFMEESLRAAGATFRAVPNLMLHGERVSSTRIRHCLERGEVDKADELLGHSYSLSGTVVLGEGRGHDLGFPTANIVVSSVKQLPKDGVYRTTARHDGRFYSGLTSIGSKPTFGGSERVVEAWLLDFERTIYGQELTLSDFHFIREQRRFSTADDLLAQMRSDTQHVTFPVLV